jgi:hypothetical protein
MLYIIGIILGIGLGLIEKGEILNFTNIKLKGLWMIFLAFAIDIAVQILARGSIQFVLKYVMLIQAVKYCLLLSMFWFNRHYLGFVTIGVGSLLNAVVVMANKGGMPVDGLLVKQIIDGKDVAVAFVNDGKHMIANASAKLTILSDIIHPPGILGIGNQIVSIGDLVVALGIFIVVFEIMIGKKIKFSFIKTGGL